MYVCVCVCVEYTHESARTRASRRYTGTRARAFVCSHSHSSSFTLCFQVKNEQATIRRKGQQLASRLPLIHIGPPDDSAKGSTLSVESAQHFGDASSPRRSSPSWRRAEPTVLRQEELRVEITPTFQTPNTDRMKFWLFMGPFVCLGVAGLFSCCGVVSDLFKRRRLAFISDWKNASSVGQDGQTTLDPATPKSRTGGVSSPCATLSFIAMLHMHAMVTESASHQVLDTTDSRCSASSKPQPTSRFSTSFW